MDCTPEAGYNECLAGFFDYLKKQFRTAREALTDDVKSKNPCGYRGFIRLGIGLL
jgi:hypothetical protein